jgi:hypothetical protein
MAVRVPSLRAGPAILYLKKDSWYSILIEVEAERKR